MFDSFPIRITGEKFIVGDTVFSLVFSFEDSFLRSFAISVLMFGTALRPWGAQRLRAPPYMLPGCPPTGMGARKGGRCDIDAFRTGIYGRVGMPP